MKICDDDDDGDDNVDGEEKVDDDESRILIKINLIIYIDFS